MSRSDWNAVAAPWIVVALGLSLVAIISFTVFYSKGYQRAHQDHQSDYAAHYEAQRDYEECRLKPTIGEAVECTKEADKAYREETRSDHDLNAQRAMADWAEGMLWVTLFVGMFTIVITGVGVVFVRATLVETRRSVKAAEDAITETRRIGEAQVRAYIVPESCVLKYKDLQPVATVTFKNSGQTPADNITIITVMTLSAGPIGALIVMADIDSQPKGIMAAGVPVTTTGTLRDREKIDGLHEGKLRIVVGGTIDYNDVFGQRWTRHFRFNALPERGIAPRGGAMLPEVEYFAERLTKGGNQKAG